MNRLFVVALATVALSAGGPALAQDHQHMPGMSGMKAGPLPQEGGQSAFDAIGEITAMLEADPTTDWSKVNIDGLRQHLVDMDNVTLRARVIMTPVPGGARFDVAGDTDAVRQSIQHMVASHTAMADGEAGRHVVSFPTADGATMTVTGSGDAAQTKIRALGFFGLMTSGVHHQLHHWMMAKGEMMHH